MKTITRKTALELGLKRYFTGKPCHHGHVCERYVSSFGCVICLTEREAKKCAENDEYSKSRQAARTSRQAKRMEKYKQDPEYYEWYCRDQIERHKTRLATDPSYAASKYARSREWFKKNPTAARSYASKRRMLIAESTENYTPSDVLHLISLQKNSCANCRVSLRGGYHVDHINPISKGGSNGKNNIQCLCPTCNIKKHNKHPIDWARENGRLL